MDAASSHGRLRLRIILGVPLTLALVCGLWVGLSWNHVQNNQIQQARLQAVADLARVVSESVWGRIDTIRERSLSVATTDTAPATDRSILTIARLRASPNGRLQLVKQWNILAAQTSTAVAGFGERLPDLIHNDKVRKLGTWSFAFGGFLGFAFPIGNDVVAALTDPVKEFGIFPWFYKNQDPTVSRAYLIDIRGQVLAHSTSSYGGGDFSRTEVFRSIVKPILSLEGSSRKQASGSFDSIDQQEVYASFLKLSQLPLGIVVEEVANLKPTSGDAQFKQLLGTILMMTGLLALLLIGTYLMARDRIVSFLQTFQPAQEMPIPTQPVATVQFSEPAWQGIGSPLSPQLARRHQPLQQQARPTPKPLNPEALIEKFEIHASNVKDLRSLLAVLTETSARLTQSNVLFFRYDERLKHLFLQFDAGFPRGKSPNAMAIKFPDNALEDIHNIAKQGQIPSLTGFQPFEELMLQRFGISFFEAWGITTFSRVPVQNPKMRIPRFLGVLIVLQPSYDSTTHRESLFQAFRTTALVHELRSESLR